MVRQVTRAHNVSQPTTRNELSRILDETCEYLSDVHANWGDPEEPLFLSLWAVHTWFINRGYEFHHDYTTYLNVVSVDPDSGKTVLAKALERITDGAVRTTPSVKAIKRFLSENRKVMFIDQFHNLGTVRASDREELNSILCNGFTSGTQDSLSNQDGGIEFYDTYFAKAFFGLVPVKPLSDEITSRAVRITLNKASREQFKVLEARQTERPPHKTGPRINSRIRAWVTRERFAELDKRMTELGLVIAINDREIYAREADLWRMMFALADMAGPLYGKRIREFAAKHTVSQTWATETDLSEANEIDRKIIRLAERGILPVDNWYNRKIAPVPDAPTVVCQSSFGWNGNRRVRGNADKQLPTVALYVNATERKADLRIPVRSAKEIGAQIGYGRDDIARIYRNANRLLSVSRTNDKQDTKALIMFSGDKKPTAILQIDFTSIIFGTEWNA